MHEPALRNNGRELDWRNAMEKLFNIWRNNGLSLWLWFLLVVVMLLFLYLSFT
jgi:hypothetical protein